MRILPGILLLLSHVLLAQQPAKPAASAAAELQSPAATGCQRASVAQVQKMMELAGSKQILEGVIETTVRHMFEDFKRMRPDIPSQVWDTILARFESPQVMQGLLDDVVPIYQRHFCADEIEQFIKFYQTSAGRKLSAEAPAIQREASEAGRNYAAHMSTQLVQDIQQELAKQGVKLGTAPKGSLASPPQPVVFILSSGERLESSHYLLSTDSLQVQQGETQRTIPLSDLNVDATIAANRARGVDLKIPSKNQVMLGF